MAYALGFILSLGIAVPAYLKKSLTRSGAIAAIIMGTLLYGFGDAIIYVSLIAFFISSSLLSKVSKLLAGTEFHKIEARLVKTGTRDHTQVMANGGVALIMALLYQFSSVEVFKLGAIIAFASACADTWASEIGILSKQQPVNILSRTPVLKGLSGGVTNLGLLASVAGALFIGIVYLITAAISGENSGSPLLELAMITVLGTLGSIIDSIIGEKWQAKYMSENQLITERKWDHMAPNRANRLFSGIEKIDGGVVNFISGLLSATLGLVAFLVAGY